MIKFLLVLLMVNPDGAQLLGVEPFDAMAGCQAELAKVAPQVREAAPSGRQFVLACVAVESGGVGI